LGQGLNFGNVLQPDSPAVQTDNFHHVTHRQLGSVTSWNFTDGESASLSTRNHLLNVDNPTPWRPAKIPLGQLALVETRQQPLPLFSGPAATT
jgi:hypothetical protein